MTVRVLPTVQKALTTVRESVEGLTGKAVEGFKEVERRANESVVLMDNALMKSGEVRLFRPGRLSLADMRNKTQGAALTIPYFREGARVHVGHLSLRIHELSEPKGLNQVVMVHDSPRVSLLGEVTAFDALIELSGLFRKNGVPCAIETSDPRGLVQFVSEGGPYQKEFHDICVDWDRRGIGKEVNNERVLAAIKQCRDARNSLPGAARSLDGYEGDAYEDYEAEATALNDLETDIRTTGGIPFGLQALMDDRRFVDLARRLFDGDTRCYLAISPI